MIYLDSVSKSLTVTLDGAVATTQCVVTSYYYDILQQSTAPSYEGYGQSSDDQQRLCRDDGGCSDTPERDSERSYHYGE
jgi:hypothetical protein